MNVVCLIQAREGSTRFPGKVFADLNGTLVLSRVVVAARAIGGMNEVYAIWPQGYPTRAEDDVLGRYADAARKHKADVVVRLTGDCPLFDPQIGTELLRIWNLGKYEYVSNVWPKRTWPDGMDCEIFTADILFRADAQATSAYDREHVTPWIREHAATYYNLTLPVNWSHVRLTVDTKEDLEWLRIALNAPRSSFDAPSK